MGKPVVLTEEARKIQHRLVERKRTRKINSLMEGLRNQVQDAGMYLRKVDKASVLSAAITCIKLLRAQRKELNAMLEVKHHGFGLGQTPQRVPLNRGHVPTSVRWPHQQMHMSQREGFLQSSM